MLQNLLSLGGGMAAVNTARQADQYGTDVDNSFDPLGYGGAIGGAALGGLGGYLGGVSLSKRLGKAPAEAQKKLADALKKGNLSNDDFLKLDKTKQLEYLRKHHITTKQIPELETRTKVTTKPGAWTTEKDVLTKQGTLRKNNTSLAIPTTTTQEYKAATGNIIKKPVLDSRGSELLKLVKTPPAVEATEAKGLSGLLGKAKVAKGGILSKMAKNPRAMGAGGALLGAMLGSQMLGNALTQDRHAQTAAQMQSYAQQDAYNQQKNLMTLQQPYQVRF